MTRTLIAELGEKIGERVTIRGWVQALRDQKRVQFVIVRDNAERLSALELGSGDLIAAGVIERLDAERDGEFAVEVQLAAESA